MKKIVFVIGILVFSMNAFAQNKGDKFFLTELGGSFGSVNIEVTDGVQSVVSKKPYNASVGAEIGMGFFVANNLRLEFPIGIGYQNTPSLESDGKWLKDEFLGAYFKPNIAYYVKLADRFYYTPEIGAGLEAGTNKYVQSYSQSSRYKYLGYGIHAKLLAFECRASNKVAFGLNIGLVTYFHSKMYNNLYSAYVLNDQFKFNFNTASVTARFYF